MKQYKVIFCGISRDNEQEIPAVISSIEETGNLFEDYCVVAYENDSADRTLEILESWKAHSTKKIKIISETHNLQKRPNLQFLGYCRNQYLQEINKGEYDDFTHVIMVDFDMKFGWPVAGIIDTFERDGWDVMAANGICSPAGHMWDAFPFRTEEFNEPYSSNKYGAIENYWPILDTPGHHRIYPPGSPLVPVYSAFGGLCIYKKSILKGLQYDLEAEDCEHVPLHNAIRGRGGKLFMNPNMVIKYSHYR